MSHLFHLYLIFWGRNTYACLFIHAMVAFVVVAIIQAIREDRSHSLYHPRVYRENYYDRHEREDSHDHEGR